MNQLDGANDFAHLPILLLSNGFERLLKMVICLDYLEREGSFPDSPGFRKKIKTHRVDHLLGRVIDAAKGWDYAERCVATRTDMDFLENDADLRRLVVLLAGYGESARYYNMNVIVGERNILDDPVQLFDSYCTDVFMRQPDWQERVSGDGIGEKIDEDIRHVNRHITELLQRFARALCRMFTLGKLGQAGQQLTGIISMFLLLRDEDLRQVQPRWFEPRESR